MRLKKGSRVEVFSPLNNFWHPARILCGNGRTYSVQYDTQTQKAQKVQRRFIRPCLLLKEKRIKWASGDIVEVLIHGSWRHAKVTGVAFGDYFIFVVLSDLSREFAVKRENVRLRHTWQDNKWIVMKKDSESREEMKKRKLIDCNFKTDAKKPRFESNKVIQGENHMNNNNNSCENESIVSSTGSCSTSGRPHNYASFTWANDDAFSSSCESEKKNRKFELDAYNATLSAFYAKGFISWEQEETLSNLRFDLNISLDEHKSLLRNIKPYIYHHN